jgi:hypothetical protein
MYARQTSDKRLVYAGRMMRWAGKSSRPKFHPVECHPGLLERTERPGTASVALNYFFSKLSRKSAYEAYQ